MRLKNASMSSWLSLRLKRLRNGTSPTSAALTSVNGAMLVHVMVGPDALDGAHGARARSGRPAGW